MRCVTLWLVFLTSATTSCGAYAETLFESQIMKLSGTFTPHIEGPSVDASGNLYICNFKSDGTIGQITPGDKDVKAFAKLPSGSIPNGIRFGKDGRMFIADWRRHNVYAIAPNSLEASVYFHSPKFNQPNDLAVSSDGILFASDPNFHAHAGQIWRITRTATGGVEGQVMASSRAMGVTNGLDLSPDEKTLYVSESDTRQIWAYALDGSRLLLPRLVKTFDEPKTGELDGLRVDADGRIFVARPGAGKISVLQPDGAVVVEVSTLGLNPSNLTFGGADGKTVYVTNASNRSIESFEADFSGREFCWHMRDGCRAER